MFESLFELLFKYRPLMFEQGDVFFRASWAGWLAVLAAVAAGVVTLRTYAKARGNSQPLDRTILTAIRLVALGVLALCLMRPVLVLSSVVPQQNFLGVLIDDSRSMQIADRDETPRLQFVEDNLSTPESELRAALNERFALRYLGVFDTNRSA